MIALGCCDSDVSQEECGAYLKRVEVITRMPMADIAEGVDKLTFETRKPDEPMTVRQVQEALRAIGFFPGGEADGICGYRTLSAIRLFQEYVRTVENLPCTPDGLFGPQSQGHLKRWIDGGLRPEWDPTIERWQAGTLASDEYTDWISLLEQVKQKYAANPNRMLSMVNDFVGGTDTKKVSEWDFDPRHIHLIGVRRSEFSGKFDDVIVLLIKGLVFKFQGSTEPGASKNEKGAPFVVQGQHDYHFGWHQKRYLALRPQGRGVLVVRSKSDMRLDDRDLDNGLTANGSINIHWAGIGGERDINSWSEGCQVITGGLYINHQDKLIDCLEFVARNNERVNEKPTRTRGAYNVLLDLVAALASDARSNTVKYTLLAEDDLALDEKLKQRLADDRAAARKRIV